MKVQKRTGEVVEFDLSKIEKAITLCVLNDAEGNLRGAPTLSAAQRELVKSATAQVRQAIERRALDGVANIEDIQDQVELALMRAGEHKIARDYVLYRDRQAQKRKTQPPVEGAKVLRLLDGNTPQEVTLESFRQIIADACEDNLWRTDPEPLFRLFERSVYDDMQVSEIDKALIISTTPLIERDPNYAFVAAKFLNRQLRREATGKAYSSKEMETVYPVYFADYIRHGVEIGRLDPRLLEFDLQELGRLIRSERDDRFRYQGMRILYDRYLIHENERRIELPQAMWMRVAMGLAINENPDLRTVYAGDFYRVLSTFRFVSSTPTLFNAGTAHPQLSSCFLTTVPDDLDGIFEAIKENALLSKFSGGLGNDWTPVRALGSYIKGTNGKSQGVVPFLKVVNDTAVAVNQGGKRKGAVCAYLETWHLDIEEFLELRKNTGDDRRRTHDMNTANWIPDLFMQRVEANAEWTLFSPNDVPDLHDLCGPAFQERYEDYERLADEGKITLFKRLPAVQLWRKMLTMLFETGHPWITFKDPCNLRSPQQHVGVVHSSNLCTEITLNSSADETAVCNLGSINLLAHIDPNPYLSYSATDERREDWPKDQLRESMSAGEVFSHLYGEDLRETVVTAMRMLDNVIDVNFYPTEKAKNANTRHRAVGLGVMGFADALQVLNIPMDSEAAVQFADSSQELISYFAIEASAALAQERGSYASFEGSLWSKGVLPIDSISYVGQSRQQALDQTIGLDDCDWQKLRDKVQRGMRNSNVMAIAPTATISNIAGVSQGIDPIYQNLYVKSNLSGEFTVVNQQLYDVLDKLEIWDEVMVNDLKYFDGSVQAIDRVPGWAKRLFATAFEIDAQWLVRMAAARQKWIDQAVSLNLYVAQPSGKYLDTLYRMAWAAGLKTTYYLRSLGATAAEKSTVSSGTLNAVAATAPKACSILDPDCEACQ